MMSRFVFSFFVVSALIFAGCDDGGPKKPAGLPSLKQCTVIVTENGATLGGTTIYFFNEDGTPTKWPTLGVTDSSGKAQIVTDEFAGAPAGKYKLALSRKIQVGAPEPPPSTASAEEFTAYENKLAKIPVSETIPDAYLKPETTPLTITVGSAKEITVEVQK